MSIDMSGVEAGTLSQTFATTIGNTYTVSFYLSGNPAGLPALKTLDVSATGGTVGSYSYDASANTLSSMNWTQETYEFMATAASTTLTFVSTTPGEFGPAIDNVVVTEIVPTKADCKHGGWRTMIDGAGNHFKNQGDCVSYFATKGKNPGALPPEAAPNPSTGSPEKHRNAHHDKVTDRHGSAHHAKAHGRHGAKSHDAKDKTSRGADHGHGSPKSHSK